MRMRRLGVLLAIAGLAYGAALTAQQADQKTNVDAQSSSAERLQRWQQTRPDQPAQVLINFGQPEPDGKIRALLERYDAAPYAVFMVLDGQYGQRSILKHQLQCRLLAMRVTNRSKCERLRSEA